MQDIQSIPGHTDELNEMLLVLDKQQNKIRGITKLTNNGEVKAADIDPNNLTEFLRIERHGDFFSNFFGNFTRQLKEPTRFDFFRVPFSLGLEIAGELQMYLNDLGEDAQKLLSKYAINSE
ncbi:hypothetical protein V1389_01540 [Flavobacterium rakeshii]|uniref:hypothetical protein n=1 Tax=Flavobacterium rakeshii TaxID=1038845 RepID=UPI002E7B2517|nr:hypothetical protein [Flavobacterium rakeshii]MEE1896999.1 hypothetical protein [Flavobacterium rakeshii]